jgi:hypothetical protein
MNAELDRAVANLLGLKSVHNCEKWVGLTIYEIDDAFNESMKVRPKEASNAETRRLFAQAIEAKLKEKNA